MIEDKFAFEETNVGKFMRALRKEKNVTLDTLCKHTHSTKQWLCYIENGYKPVGAEVFNKVSEYFNLTQEQREQFFKCVVEDLKIKKGYRV